MMTRNKTLLKLLDEGKLEELEDRLTENVMEDLALSEGVSGHDFRLITRLFKGKDVFAYRVDFNGSLYYAITDGAIVFLDPVSSYGVKITETVPSSILKLLDYFTVNNNELIEVQLPTLEALEEHLYYERPINAYGTVPYKLDKKVVDARLLHTIMKYCNPDCATTFASDFKCPIYFEGYSDKEGVPRFAFLCVITR